MNFSSRCPGRIKEERLRLGLSQAQAAEKTGVSREMWGRYERGDAIPGGEVLFSFAAAAADVQYILTGNRQVTSDVEVEEPLKDFGKLSAEDQQCVQRFVTALAKENN